MQDLVESHSEYLECDQEPLQFSGQIQPLGILFELQPQGKITCVSENTEVYLGVSPDVLLGCSFLSLLSRRYVKPFQQFLQQSEVESLNPFELGLSIPTSLHPQGDRQPVYHFEACLHRHPQGQIILELEAITERKRVPRGKHPLQSLMVSVRQTKTLTEFVQRLADEVREIDSFDRVMIYHFDPQDYSGEVIAEAKAEPLESYLGLHYPASDIPPRARKLYSQNWVRYIPAVDHSPVKLLALAPWDAQTLDLTKAEFRSVFPGHLEYLGNMGVKAALSISIRNEDHLWGLITCHHYSPKTVTVQTRKLYEVIGQFASMELLRQQELEQARHQIEVQKIQERLRQAFTSDQDWLEQIIHSHQTEVLELVGATGAAIIFNEKLTLIAQTPQTEEIQDLLHWSRYHHPQEIFATDRLGELYPPAQSFTDRACGILIASIFIKQQSHHLIWFKPEQIQQVNWAGANCNPVITTASGQQRYTPRRSFDLWQETVRGKSSPWEPLEIEAAQAFRQLFLQTILQLSQIALQRSETMERAAREAAIANQAKSQFLAKMSHELRTPLTAILGFANLIARDQSLVQSHRDHLDIISRSGEHLLSLINDVLEMSKIESGQTVLSTAPFDLHRLLCSLRDMFILKARKKEVELILDLRPNLPQYVRGDENKLRQILLNLVGNAIKFTDTGSVLLRVSAKPNGQDSGWDVSFEVKDTGSGIVREELELIFEPFKQTSEGRFLQGSGLGLSISRQFARLMGGDLSVSSIFGQGSTFTCHIPLVTVEPGNLLFNQAIPLVMGLKPDQPRYRILVVEDMQETRQLLLNLLVSVGFQARAAENGEAAIAICLEWRPHLIWMDMRMPVLDGYEATKRIRKLPGGDKINIIALTASAFEDERRASLRAGCDDFVTKPFTESTFFNIIAHYLGLEYIYADAIAYEVADTKVFSSQNITSQDLQFLGQTWIQAVHEAASLLDEDHLKALITEIPPTQQAIAESLNYLVSQLQFEAILELTQS